MGSMSRDAEWRAVQAAARGKRDDYRLEAAPIGVGGQAHVFRAAHKPTGVVVAFKRLRQRRNTDAIARMRREIEVGRRIDHPNVMPILDADDEATWLVMPLALDNLEGRRKDIIRSDGLRLVVEQVCAGVSAAHAHGWIHRDVKPNNVLLLAEPDRWVVADWGLVKRPAGSTTAKGRTRVGVSYGTQGFAPPELSHDAHRAQAFTDIYYIGQLIGWCLVGTYPLQNVPLLPPEGPWRTVVRAATWHEPGRRPQSIAALQRLIEEAFYRPADPPEVVAEALLQRLDHARNPDAAVDEILDLVEQNPENDELCLDLLPRLSSSQLEQGVVRSRRHGFAVVEVLCMEHAGPRRDYRSYGWVDSVIISLLDVASAAARTEDLELLDKAATALFAWDAAWDQWTPQKPIGRWLTALQGLAAGVVAQTLSDEPDAGRHFSDEASDRRTDRRIRDAIRRAIGP
jgi:serine/threonine protein kinase